MGEDEQLNFSNNNANIHFETVDFYFYVKLFKFLVSFSSIGSFADFHF